MSYSTQHFMKHTATRVRGRLVNGEIRIRLQPRRHCKLTETTSIKRIIPQWYFFFAIHLLLFSCQAKQHMETNKYTWLGTLSAPTEYPVEVYKGAISSDDYTYGFDPIWGVFHPGWGETAGVMSAENDPAHLPNRFEITWYSVKENKYYSGKWSIDPAAIQSLIQRNEPDIQREFTFMIGLAPEGLVNFWLIGQQQQLIATFQAEKTQLDPQNTDDSFEHHFREEYRETAYDLKQIFDEQTYADIQNGGEPPAKWYKEINRLYDWKGAVKGIEISSINTIFYRTFNGEHYTKSLTEMANTSSSRPLPNKMYVNWTTADNTKMVAVADFSYEAIQKAFEQISAKEPSQLQLEIDVDQRTVNVHLIAGNQKIEVETKKSIVTEE